MRMGKSPCSAWVPILWGKCRGLFTKNKPKDSSIPDLPCDIIINILSRLPATCISQLWESKSYNLLYDLTTTRHFMRAHLQFMPTHLDGPTPTIIVQSLKKSSDDDDDETIFFLFDGKATSFDLSSCNTASRKEPLTLWGSYDGFLLFRSTCGPTRHFYILNPITKEQVILVSPDEYFYACGLFFHPEKKEYEVICASYLGQRIWEFQILNLKTNHGRSVGRCGFPPSRKRPPVFINNTFYWMVNWSMYYMANGISPSLSESIVSFNLETGEFRTMEIPELFDVSPQHIKYPEEEFHLFEMDGELSLFGTSSKKEVVIWVRSRCHFINRWVKKHLITSPDQEPYWNFTSYFRDFEYMEMKGEFIVYDRWDRKKQPLVYDLSLNTWKLFERKEFQRDGYFVITSHTHSLVSLDAADSVIPLLQS